MAGSVVRDIMTKQIVMIDHDKSALEAAKTMAEKGISSVFVVRDGQPVGIVSERDVVRHLHHDGTVVNNTVRAIMTDVVETAEPSMELDDLMEIMTSRRFRHVPVVEDGRLVGIVSIGDAVKHKMNQLEFERDQLDSYVHQT